MLVILAIVLFLLSGFDAWITQSRIRKYGPTVELNRAISKLSTVVGPELGAILGVMVPSTALIVLCLMAHLQWVLGMMIGFRLRAFFVQVESIVFEKQIREFADSLKSASISGSHAHPSCVAPLFDDKVEPRTAGPFSEGDNDRRR
jgi:hypothetical protein